MIAGLLLAEWTKLRSVPAWVATLAATVALMAAIGLLAAVGFVSEHDGGGAAAGAVTDVRDEGRFVHRPLAGDGEVVARVVTQADSHPWAKAGLMIRASARAGSPYAAIMVTPGHGVRMQSDFRDVAGAPARGPRWLRLRRAGDTVGGWESADGARWRRVGEVALDGLPATAAAGLFVASPDDVEVARQLGGEVVDARSTVGRATFDDVGGGLAPRDGPFTLTAAGDVGSYAYGDDLAELALSGVLLATLAVVAVAVLSIASEYQRGTIRTTFAATPQRGRVLAAKAAVVGGATFAVGLVASVAALLIAGPPLRADGVAAPSLADGPVLRAVVGTALLLALVALLSIGVAAIVRHTAAAISIVVLLLLLPQIVATGLPVSTAVWLERVSPAAGFAIQQTVRRYDSAIDPWPGLAVLCGWTALALAGAVWRLTRSDA